MKWVGEARVVDGALERELEVECDGRRVPGLLWSPAAAGNGLPEGMPLVLLGHGGALHKRAPYIEYIGRTLAARHGVWAAAIDGPVHGDRRVGDDENDVGAVMGDLFSALSDDSALLTAAMVADWKAVLDALEAAGLGDCPVGYWGVSMGTMFGVPFVAAEPRVRAAVLGLCAADPFGLLPLAEAAGELQCPVLFLEQLDDEIFAPADVNALFAAIGSVAKTLHVHPGGHASVPIDEVNATIEWLVGQVVPEEARPAQATGAHGGDLASAWAAFCTTQSDLASAFTDAESPLDRAEGVRALARLASVSLDLLVENRDPAHPLVTRVMTETRKFGLDNPDTTYDYVPLSGERTYRVRGNRGDTHYLAFCVYSGTPDNPLAGRFVANVSDADLHFDEGGNFELYLGPRRPDGVGATADFVELAPDTANVTIRQYFLDRVHDRPATFDFECLDAPAPAAPLDEERLALRLRQASAALSVIGGLCAGAPKLIGRSPNRLVPRPGGETAGLFGTPDNTYVVGLWSLEEDEALVIETVPPAGRYWNLHLANRWTESLDWRHARVSINHSQAKFEDDGSVRLVIAHSDPGVPNWLQTGGRREGFMALRWLLAESAPRPTCTVVKLASLRES